MTAITAIKLRTSFIFFFWLTATHMQIGDLVRQEENWRSCERHDNSLLSLGCRVSSFRCLVPFVYRHLDSCIFWPFSSSLKIIFLWPLSCHRRCHNTSAKAVSVWFVTSEPFTSRLVDIPFFFPFPLSPTLPFHSSLPPFTQTIIFPFHCKNRIGRYTIVYRIKSDWPAVAFFFLPFGF